MMPSRSLHVNNDRSIETYESERACRESFEALRELKHFTLMDKELKRVFR